MLITVDRQWVSAVSNFIGMNGVVGGRALESSCGTPSKGPTCMSQGSGGDGVFLLIGRAESIIAVAHDVMKHRSQRVLKAVLIVRARKRRPSMRRLVPAMEQRMRHHRRRVMLRVVLVFHPVHYTRRELAQMERSG